jgi:hypothetical protein
MVALEPSSKLSLKETPLLACGKNDVSSSISLIEFAKAD